MLRANPCFNRVHQDIGAPQLVAAIMTLVKYAPGGIGSDELKLGNVILDRAKNGRSEH